MQDGRTLERAADAGRRAAILGLLLTQLAACGGLAERTDGAVVAADSGRCGTHANPGVLTLTSLVPALGSTVPNQTIVHGFTVVGAPAVFTNFDLKFRPSHTAGLSVPADPQFQVTQSENNVIYQLTIDSWSRAPGHVELVANGWYDTAQNCTWVFPSPLFSYDLSPGPDGGVTAEAGRPADSAVSPVDTTTDGAKVDAPIVAIDAAIDGEAVAIDTALDSESIAIDTAVDSTVAAVDASAIDGASGSLDGGVN
jgi:hypothetical protein